MQAADVKSLFTAAGFLIFQSTESILKNKLPLTMNQIFET